MGLTKLIINIKEKIFKNNAHIEVRFIQRFDKGGGIYEVRRYNEKTGEELYQDKRFYIRTVPKDVIKKLQYNS